MLLGSQIPGQCKTSSANASHCHTWWHSQQPSLIPAPSSWVRHRLSSRLHEMAPTSHFIDTDLRTWRDAVLKIGGSKVLIREWSSVWRKLVERAKRCTWICPRVHLLWVCGDTDAVGLHLPASRQVLTQGSEVLWSNFMRSWKECWHCQASDVFHHLQGPIHDWQAFPRRVVVATADTDQSRDELWVLAALFRRSGQSEDKQSGNHSHSLAMIHRCCFREKDADAHKWQASGTGDGGSLWYSSCVSCYMVEPILLLLLLMLIDSYCQFHLNTWQSQTDHFAGGSSIDIFWSESSQVWKAQLRCEFSEFFATIFTGSHHQHVSKATFTRSHLQLANLGELQVQWCCMPPIIFGVSMLLGMQVAIPVLLLRRNSLDKLCAYESSQAGAPLLGMAAVGAWVARPGQDTRTAPQHLCDKGASALGLQPLQTKADLVSSGLRLRA